MKKCTSGQEVPVGLGIALEKNNGMDFFFSLSASEQQRIIDQAQSVQSKEEMLAYVQTIMENEAHSTGVKCFKQTPSARA